MIQFPCTNYFDAKFPILEDGEEEVFYQHPLFDIKCNQLGALYLNEDKYYAVYAAAGTYIRSKLDDGNLKFHDNLGTKQKIVWECYNGIRLRTGKHFHQINSNPLDFSLNNIIPTGSQDRKLVESITATRKKFIRKSVERLLELEDKYEKRGMQKEDLYQILHLPPWLIVERNKWDPLGTKPKVKRGDYVGKASKVTPEEEQRIIHYFDQDLTYGEIMLRMGYKSKTPIRRILYKWGRSRKK